MARNTKAVRKTKEPVGVFVPAAQLRLKPLTERIESLKSRNLPKGYLEIVPPSAAPPTYAELLAKRAEIVSADNTRRESFHREFLAEKPTGYEIRWYLKNELYRMYGTWTEYEAVVNPETGEVIEEAWAGFRAELTCDVDDHIRARIAFVAEECERCTKLIDAEVSPVCEHGTSWHDRCAFCNAELDLVLRGKDPKILDKLFIGAPEEQSHVVNTVCIDSGKWAGHQSGTVNAGNKLWQIDAAVQTRAITGGRRLTAGASRINLGTGEYGRGANGPDSDAGNGEDHAAGSQTSSKEPNYFGGKTATELGLSPERARKELKALVEREVEYDMAHSDEMLSWTQTKRMVWFKKEAMCRYRELAKHLPKRLTRAEKAALQSFAAEQAVISGKDSKPHDHRKLKQSVKIVPQDDEIQIDIDAETEEGVAQ